MATSPFLSEDDLHRFRTKPCRREKQKGCEFGRNRCQYSHNDYWPRRCPFYLTDRSALRYLPYTCPQIKLGDNDLIVHNACDRGGHCPFAHSWEEVLYHPLFYKTSICKLFHQGECECYYCPYVHGLAEHRLITRTYTLPYTRGILLPSHPNVCVQTKPARPIASPPPGYVGTPNALSSPREDRPLFMNEAVLDQVPVAPPSRPFHSEPHQMDSRSSRPRGPPMRTNQKTKYLSNDHNQGYQRVPSARDSRAGGMGGVGEACGVSHSADSNARLTMMLLDGRKGEFESTDWPQSPHINPPQSRPPLSHNVGLTNRHQPNESYQPHLNHQPRQAQGNSVHQPHFQYAPPPPRTHPDPTQPHSTSHNLTELQSTSLTTNGVLKTITADEYSNLNHVDLSFSQSTAASNESPLSSSAGSIGVPRGSRSAPDTAASDSLKTMSNLISADGLVENTGNQPVFPSVANGLSEMEANNLHSFFISSTNSSNQSIEKGRGQAHPESEAPVVSRGVSGGQDHPDSFITSLRKSPTEPFVHFSSDVVSPTEEIKKALTKALDLCEALDTSDPLVSRAEFEEVTRVCYITLGAVLTKRNRLTRTKTAVGRLQNDFPRAG
eukprot:GHVN01034354.1.p1 GENE.GHVN01034354.1~~GHVN01034354.1.p1  ORF type:complete len:608 (-),score=116.38 GHVN01034354.1:185-2008(-)